MSEESRKVGNEVVVKRAAMAGPMTEGRWIGVGASVSLSLG